MARAGDDLPLVFRALGTDSLPRGTHVRVRVTGIDLLTLDLHASLAARLDDLIEEEAAAEEDGEAEEAPAGTLTLAIDLADDAGDAQAAPAPSPAP